VKSQTSPGYSDYEMVEFRILRVGIKANSRIITLGFRRTDFGLLRDFLGSHKIWSRRAGDFQGILSLISRIILANV